MPAILNGLQEKTLDSIRPLDGQGYFYEMTYYADYCMDDVIELARAGQGGRMSHIRRALFKEGGEPVRLKSRYMSGGCSAFAALDPKGRPVFARNYDWKDKGSVMVLMHTPAIPGKRYASISTTDLGHVGVGNESLLNDDSTREGFLYAPYCGASDGVNEKGFCVGIQILYYDSAFQDDGRPALDVGMVARLLLDRADCVDSAIRLLREYDVKRMYERAGSLHWLLADARGERAVIEYVDGKLCINRCPCMVEIREGKASVQRPETDRGYVLSTNFYVTEGGQDPARQTMGGYWRYSHLEALLRDNPNPDTKEAMEMLKEVCYSRDIAVNFGAASQSGVRITVPTLTLTSAVYGVLDRSVELCLREDYEKVYSFRLFPE